MAKTRIQFSNMLKEVTGCNNLYFQPGANITMKYPAIVYARNKFDNTSADNIVYMQNVEYSVTVIDSNPDSDIVLAVSQIPTARHDRNYKSDNLNHDVFTIIY